MSGLSTVGIAPAGSVDAVETPIDREAGGGAAAALSPALDAARMALMPGAEGDNDAGAGGLRSASAAAGPAETGFDSSSGKLRRMEGSLLHCGKKRLAALS